MATEQESTRRPSIQHTLHRPADEIADRPQLKVKPISRQDDAEVAEEAFALPETAAETVAQAATIIVEPSEPVAPVAPVAPAAPETPDVPDAVAPEAAGLPEPDQAPMGEQPRKVGKLPRIDPGRDPSLYATHGPAPADAAAEKAHLAAVTGQRAKDREISAGFLLGIALIVLVLVGGVLIVRLQKHVQRLENRVSQLEQGRTQTASAAPVR